MSMQKLEFLVRLERELGEISSAERKEIMSDFEAHFQDAMQTGKTEEDILNALGSVQTIAGEILEQHRQQASLEGQTGEDTRSDDEGERSDGYSISEGAHAEESTHQFSASAFSQEDLSQSNLCIRTLRIHTSEVDVAIESYEGDRIGYRIESDEPEKFDIRDYVDGDTYSISARMRYNAKRFFSFINLQHLGYGDHKLYIRVPSSYQGDIQVVSESGDIDMQHVRADQLQMELSSGDGVIRQGAFQDVRVTSKSGDIRMESSSAERISMEASSGDVDIRSINTHTMAVRTSSGDVDIEQLHAEEFRAEVMSGDLSLSDGVGLNWYLSSSSGDIEAERIRANMDIVSHSGEVEIDELNGALILKSSSGDVECTFGRDIGPSVIESKSGDIDVRISSWASNVQIEAMADHGDLSVKLPQVRTETERRDYYRGSIGADGPVVRVASVSGDIELRETRA